MIKDRAFILGGRQQGKSLYQAFLRDEALAQGKTVAIMSPKEGGGIHTCIVKPFKRK